MRRLSSITPKRILAGGRPLATSRLTTDSHYATHLGRIRSAHLTTMRSGGGGVAAHQCCSRRLCASSKGAEGDMDAFFDDLMGGGGEDGVSTAAPTATAPAATASTSASTTTTMNSGFDDDDMFAQLADTAASFEGDVESVADLAAAAVAAGAGSGRALTKASTAGMYASSSSAMSHLGGAADDELTNAANRDSHTVLQQKEAELADLVRSIEPLMRLPPSLRRQFDANDASNKVLLKGLEKALADAVSLAKRPRRAMGEEDGSGGGDGTLFSFTIGELLASHSHAIAAIKGGVGVLSPNSPITVAWRCAGDECGGKWRARIRDRVEGAVAVEKVLAAYQQSSAAEVGSERALVDATHAAAPTAEDWSLFASHGKHHCPICVAKVKADVGGAKKQMAGGEQKNTPQTDKVSHAEAAASIVERDLPKPPVFETLVNTFPLVAASWDPALNSRLAKKSSAAGKDGDDASSSSSGTKYQLSHVLADASTPRYWWSCGTCRRAWRESALSRTAIRNGNPQCPRCQSRDALIAETTAAFSQSDAAARMGKTLKDVPYVLVDLHPLLSMGERPVVDAHDGGQKALDAMSSGITADALGDALLGDDEYHSAAPSPAKANVDEAVPSAAPILEDVLGGAEETEESLTMATAAEKAKFRQVLIQQWASLPAESTQVAQWRCAYCSYLYKMSVRERALMGKDCPSCTGKIAFNRHNAVPKGGVMSNAKSTLAETNPAHLLVKQRPDVAAEMTEVSSHKIETLTIFDSRMFSFVCRACLTPYRQRLRDRCMPHGGCPSCDGNPGKHRLAPQAYRERMAAANLKKRTALKDHRLMN